MDPHSQNHATTNAILMHAYEGLTRYSAKYEVEPALATKWTFISPTQVRFELRKGVKFHDGTPFTADDVVFSFGRIKQPQGTMQIYVTGINEMKKVDDHTVDIILAAPNPLLLRNIVDFRIMSKAWSEKNRTANVQDYKAKEENFASRNVDGHRRLQDHRLDARAAHHDDHQRRLVGQAPRATSRRWSTRRSRATPRAWRRCCRATWTCSPTSPPRTWPACAATASSRSLDGPEVRTIFFAPDVGSPELKYSNVKGKNPFADKRVRQALSMAIDREAIKRNIMRGLSIPAGLMVARASTATRPTSTCRPRSTPTAPRSCWPTPATPTASRCA